MATGTHFAIIGVAKRKGRAELARAAEHHLRDGIDAKGEVRRVRNADPARLTRNVASWRGGSAKLVDSILERTTPLKRRKDAVDCIEVLLTASPAWFAEHGGKGSHADLAAAAEAYLLETFGDANLMAWGIHLDETTPHVWAMVTPVTPKGTLSASWWTDGPKALAQMHDQWAKATAHLGLVRGVAGSPSTHIAIRDHYSAVNGDPTAIASIEAEMRRRAISAQRVEAGAKKRAKDLEDRELELAAREAKVVAREARLNEERRRLIQQQVEMRQAWEALTPDAKLVAGQRMTAIKQRDQAADAAIGTARKRPQPR